MARSSLPEKSTVAGLGALAGCELPGVATDAPRTPFTAPVTCVPILGTGMTFPMRRIDCLGRDRRREDAPRDRQVLRRPDPPPHRRPDRPEPAGRLEDARP
jgi:hypothetical protein